VLALSVRRVGSDKRAERSGGKIETPNGLTGRQERWPRRIIHDGYVPRTQHIDQPKEQWRRISHGPVYAQSSPRVRPAHPVRTAEPKVPSNSLQKTTEQIESPAAQTYIHGLYSRNQYTADYTA
jgi:hypothetical protein